MPNKTIRHKGRWSYALGLMLIALAVGVNSCKNNRAEETILEGKTTVLVDKTVFPITEDVLTVFESQYPATIQLDSLSEAAAVEGLLNGKAEIAILSRRLTEQENALSTLKGVAPRVTALARDAVVFITNPGAKDTLLDLEDVVKLLQGKASKVSKLVFDDPNSGIVRLLDSVAGTAKGEKANVYSLGSHEDVLKYIAKNKDAVGVVGLNALLQPYPNWEQYERKITVMAVRNVKSKLRSSGYYKPNQSNIVAGLYPLVRTIYLLNYQGKAGLGMGFASYMAGEDGQRIILKSGLVPVRIPGRNIEIRKEIITK